MTMKATYLLMIFLLMFSCNPIKEPFIPKQEVWVDVHYQKGFEFLKKGNVDRGIKAFHSAQIFDSVSSKSIKSKRIIDSLLPIFRQSKTEQLKGRWKLKKLNFDPYPGSYSEFIEFNDTHITFYSYKSDGELRIDRLEKINYEKYDSKYIFFDPYRLEFTNGEIWAFEINNKQTTKRLYPIIYKGIDGLYHFTDVGMILTVYEKVK